MPYRMMTVFVVSAACAWASHARAADQVLAEGGKSAYQIVVADDASPSTKHGAEELQKFLEEMTGAKLPIVSDKQPAGPKEIILGDNAHFRALKTDIDVASLGAEGYVIRTVGDHLVIVGGALRGNMYGVYGLLEDHLGCRWFTPDCSRIPKSAKLVLADLNDRQIPALEYREPFLADCFDGDWCARNRMNSSMGRLEAKHGGKVLFAPGFFVHSFERLVPPSEYFDAHPEYYAMIDGKRIKEQRGLASQLCCTNPEVIRICTERVFAAIRAYPAATVFSVSQNDAYAGPNQCECEKCQALAKAEDSQMAPVLQLVNHVAEAVEKEFPDKIVETLAYQWSMRPPKTMRPRPNVVIRLCSSACCSHPIATCDSKNSREFHANLDAWSKIADRLWIWDYVTEFAHYLLPFPNQRTRVENVRFFVAHNVKGLFEQDAYTSPQSELAALGGYVTAKCLWNPNYDGNVAMTEFLENYYGKAAAPIREYIDLMHDFVERENMHLMPLGPAPLDSPHLNDALLKTTDAMWQRAEKAVARDLTLLHRVQIARLSVDYAILERGRLRAQKTLPASPDAAALAKARLAPFSEAFRNSEVTQFGEGRPVDKEVYLRDLANALHSDGK
jgi:hypothetical protein